MSTQTSAEAAQLLADEVLQDTVQIFDVGPTVTVGFEVTRELTPVGGPVRALVQTTLLANAEESRVDSVYSVKVPVYTDLRPGQVVGVVVCQLEPSLVGKELLLGKVSQNGAALLRKAVASDFQYVDQQGKGGLS